MTNTNDPDQPPHTIDHEAGEPARARSPATALAVLALLGVVILACVIGYLRQNEPPPADTSGIADRLAQLDARLGRLDARLGQVGQRLEALDAKPAQQPAAATDLGPLEQRVGALERKPAPDVAPLDQRIGALERKPAPPPPDLRPLQDRIAALEGREIPDVAPLDERIGALEQKPAPDPADQAARAGLAAVGTRLDTEGTRLETVATRLDALLTRQDASEKRIGERLDADEKRLGDRLDAEDAKLADVGRGTAQASGQVASLVSQVKSSDLRLATAEQALGKLPEMADRATRLTRLQAAQTALNAGEKLGALPDAPEPVARYADQAPPTEARLKLAFPAAAKAASAAASPVQADQPLGQRLWSRAQSLVTVRQGDKVLVGDPSAGVVARAKTALDAGDLQGAVNALGALQGAPADAFKDWLEQARGLLAARTALASMIARG